MSRKSGHRFSDKDTRHSRSYITRQSPVRGSRRSVGSPWRAAESGTGAAFTRSSSALMRRISFTAQATMAPAPSAPIANLTSGGITKAGMDDSPSTSSQTVTRPQRPRLQRRDHLAGEIGTMQKPPPLRRTHPRLHPAEPAAHRGYERGDDIVTEALAQRRTQVTDAVGDGELDRLAPGPKLAGEQVIFGTNEAGAAALLHQRNKILVNVPLHRLEPVHVVRLFRQERVEHGLALARSVEPPLDSKLLHQVDEAEGAAADPDPAHAGGGMADDLVGGAGDHVAAGGDDVLGEGDHRNALLLGELPDAAVDRMRLHRRAAGRIDQQRHRPRAAHAERALQRTRDARQGDPRAQRLQQADGAGKPDHRHHRNIPAQPLRQERT